jgi:uncharacterized protein (TIGR03382 family)
MARALTLLFVLVTLAGPVRAADTWRNVAPGVDLLKRTTSGQRKQVIHAAKIDLTRQEYQLRSNRKDPGADERGRTTGSFARLVKAVVAINGDWGPGSAPWNPKGLAVGEGNRWNDDLSNWRFFACTMFNECQIDRTRGSAVTPDPRWWAAVGSNGSPLIKNGVRNYGGSYDCAAPCDANAQRHPRSALGLDAEARTLWMVVVEGRRPEAAGMTFNETIDLMADLGAHDAVMQDGGGSSTLVVNGTRVNNLPANQSSERTVSNHLALIRADGNAPQCASRKKGRWCTGDTIKTCSAGRFESGNCAAFGAACREDGNWAFCVDPRCRAGQGTHCAGDKLVTCTPRADGNYDVVEAACPAGQACSGAAGSAACGAASTCGNGTCDAGETCATCGGDCGACETCGNGACDAGETCSSCEDDCGACATCGDGTCDAGETCSSCEDDCGACATCGDGTCDAGETCSICEDDCGACEACGDGTCGEGESCASCEGDCGACAVCGDGQCALDESCSACASDCGDCASCGDGRCSAGESCVSCDADCGACGSCGNGVCSDGETCESCALDCGRCPVCGDGFCAGAETCEDCDTDCGPCEACGDGTCSARESCLRCPRDCGACPPGPEVTPPPQPAVPGDGCSCAGSPAASLLALFALSALRRRPRDGASTLAGSAPSKIT